MCQEVIQVSFRDFNSNFRIFDRQEQEIQRRERELDSTVRRPAEAEKFRLEKIAEANRNRLIMEAEADAEAEILRGEAKAFAIEAAEAEQVIPTLDNDYNLIWNSEI